MKKIKHLFGIALFISIIFVLYLIMNKDIYFHDNIKYVGLSQAINELRNGNVKYIDHRKSIFGNT